MLNYLSNLGQHQHNTYPRQGVKLVLVGVQSYEFDCLRAKEDTESSLLYLGICPNAFPRLHKANPRSVPLLFERTEKT